MIKSKFVFKVLCWATCLLVAASTHAQPYPASTSAHQAISLKQLNIEQYKLHYAVAGDSSKPGVIFIHGSPGGWQAFVAYLESEKLRQDFLLVSFDRLGWGKSNMRRAEVDGDFDLQARSVIAIMDTHPDKKWILVGHSLGASIAPKVALFEPERVAGLLLLAGSLDPELGHPRWFNRAASTWLVSKMIPQSLRKSNNEIMALSKQLEIMSEQISDTFLPAHLVVMQGLNDKLVSPKNTRYVEKHWQDNFADVKLMELSDAGHFLPWQKTQLVSDTIRELARTTQLTD